MAKRFFCVSLGVLALAIAYGLGGVAARAEEGSSAPVIVAAGSTGGDYSHHDWIVTSTGDVYVGDSENNKPWRLSGNVFTGKVAK